MRHLILVIVFSAGAALAQRQYYAPGAGYINESAAIQHAVPAAYVNQTVSGGAPARRRNVLIVKLDRKLKQKGGLRCDSSFWLRFWRAG